MKQRTITGIIAVAILALVLLFKSILLRPAIVILAFLGLHEFYNGFKEKYKTMNLITYIFAAINFLVIALLEGSYPIFANFLACMMTVMIVYFITILIFAVFNHAKYSVIDVMVTLFGYVYVVILFTFLYLLATTNITMSSANINTDYCTLFYLFILFSVSWGADMGGYFTGIVCGKHKLCEKLSPKKTIEGAIGGTLFSIALGFMVIIFYNYYTVLIEQNSFWNIREPINIVYISLLVGALSIISQIGDFVASSIKRYVGIKDYSNIMPGHGGVLDRFDSLIFVTPILYFILNLL